MLSAVEMIVLLVGILGLFSLCGLMHIMQQVIKDLHGRLCALEEKNKVSSDYDKHRCDDCFLYAYRQERRRFRMR